MTTEKKNQHYIPKFFLRNFSFENNKKQIGVYNTENEFFIAKAKLKTQGSKKFFYGCDGKIEDDLSNIEDNLATLIKDIISTKILPAKNSDQHYELLSFVALTDLRNPVTIDGFNESFSEIGKRLFEMDRSEDVKRFMPDFSRDQIVRLNLYNANYVGAMMLDLDYKLLINKTTTPFITSDFPIVKYNQFLELKKWRYSKTGYGLTGLQLFIPITDELLLVFFDRAIYKLGDKKKSCHIVTNETDIDEINKLQFLNCLSTIFFSEKANEYYIRQLHNQAKKFKRAHTTNSELNYLIREGDEDNQRAIDAGMKNFIIVGQSDCETKLKIDGLKIHSKGHAHQLNDSLAQLRPMQDKIRKDLHEKVRKNYKI